MRDADGGWGLVERVRVVVNPQMMYDLTVAEAHTFFVGDGEWLVHNLNCAKSISQSIKKSGTWRRFRPNECPNGCDEVANVIHNAIGGEIAYIHSALSSGRRRPALLPNFDGYAVGWQRHTVVVRGDRVYDAFTGSNGQPFAEYMSRWDFPDDVLWPWSNL